MRCSTGKVVLSTAFFFLGLAVTHLWQNVKSAEADQSHRLSGSSIHFAKRGLASITAFSKNDIVEEDHSSYVEVGRLRPRKLDLNYIRRMMDGQDIHEHQPALLLQPQTHLRKMASDLANNGNISQKLASMESKRQDIYLDLLRKRGQLIDMDSGSRLLVSLAQMPLRMPRTLKTKKFADWLEREKVWANVSHFPWSLDDQCNFYAVQFGQKLPIIGLVSYPSSGNTWLRYLIEGATGYYTGSMYNDITIAQKGFYGEGVPYDAGMSVAVKSHGYTTGDFSLKATTTSKAERLKNNHMEELRKTAILLLRNPFRAIIGHRHLDEGGHTGHAKDASFSGTAWERFVSIKIKSWENFYVDWLTTPGTLTKVVHFENLKDTLQWNLLRILDFLGLKPDMSGRMQCLLKHQEGFFHRVHKNTTTMAETKKDPFTEGQKKAIRQAIDRVNRALKEAGKETMPLHKYDYY